MENCHARCGRAGNTLQISTSQVLTVAVTHLHFTTDKFQQKYWNISCKKCE